MKHGPENIIFSILNVTKKNGLKFFKIVKINF
jgi:hypothetical protein